MKLNLLIGVSFSSREFSLVHILQLEDQENLNGDCQTRLQYETVLLVAYVWDLVRQLLVVVLSVTVWLETATMTWQGWIALASMIVGVWTMSHFIFVRPMKKVQQQSAKVKQQTQIV